MFETELAKHVCFVVCVTSAVVGTLFASCAGANLSPNAAIAACVWYLFAWGAYSVTRNKK